MTVRSGDMSPGRHLIEFDKAAAKPREHGFDVVISRIEGKYSFGLHPARLVSNGLE